MPAPQSSSPQNLSSPLGKEETVLWKRKTEIFTIFLKNCVQEIEVWGYESVKVSPHVQDLYEEMLLV